MFLLYIAGCKKLPRLVGGVYRLKKYLICIGMEKSFRTVLIEKFSYYHGFLKMYDD